jgi:uncharacterized protein YjiK
MIPSPFPRHRGPLAAGAVALAAAWGGVFPFEGTSLEPIDICPASVLREPSGIVYHPGRKTLFAVGDEGDLVEMTTGGEVRARGRLREQNLDLEGITVGHDGALYVVVENPPKIMRVSPDDLVIEQSKPVELTLDEKQVICLTSGGGLEGLCYVPEHDAFYAVNQLEPARLVEITFPPDTVTAQVSRIIAELDDPIQCASDLAWEPRLGCFLVTSASYKSRPGLIWEVTLDGKIGKSRRLPGREQEGFCLDADGNAYVAQDCGGILKCEPYREEDGGK